MATVYPRAYFIFISCNPQKYEIIIKLLSKQDRDWNKTDHTSWFEEGVKKAATTRWLRGNEIFPRDISSISKNYNSNDSHFEGG